MKIKEKINSAKDLIRKARYVEAEDLLRNIKYGEEAGEVHQLLGITALKLNRENDAVNHFELAVENLQANGFLYHNLAIAYKAIGNIEDSKIAFRKAADLQPDFAEPLNQLALLYKENSDITRAESFYKEAISRNNDYVEAYFNLAVLMEKAKRSVEACDYYRKALKLRPNYIMAINNLAGCLTDLGNFEEAENLYRIGIEKSRQTSELHSGLGACLNQQGKFQAGRKELLKAVEISPNSAIHKWNLGFLQLAMSEFISGWSNYRYRNSVNRKVFLMPEKRFPQDLKGDEVCIAAEQGLGDQLFFVRFFSELKRRGANIVFRPDKKLESILGRTDIATVKHSRIPQFSIGDLPYLLGCEKPLPSLRIEPLKDSVAPLREKLYSLGPPPFIGFSYRAGGVDRDTLFKEVPARELASIFRSIRGTMLFLQRNPEPDELDLFSSSLGREVFDFSYINENLEEALALISLLDDYVGVSNTNMHLRAAVGKSARVLVTHPGEYRWQLNCHVSAWFPSFSLYRQSFDRSWHEAFSQLKSDLIKKYD